MKLKINQHEFARAHELKWTAKVFTKLISAIMSWPILERTDIDTVWSLTKGATAFSWQPDKTEKKDHVATNLWCRREQLQGCCELPGLFSHLPWVIRTPLCVFRMGRARYADSDKPVNIYASTFPLQHRGKQQHFHPSKFTSREAFQQNTIALCHRHSSRHISTLNSLFLPTI